MNAARCVLAIISGCALGVLIGEIILGLGTRWGGIAVAVIAACVLLRFLIKAVQEDRQLNGILREAREPSKPGVMYLDVKASVNEPGKFILENPRSFTAIDGGKERNPQ